LDKEISFRFERDPEYRVLVANGAWGGPTPRGEIMFDLFFEHADVPEEIAYMATPDGLGPEISRSPQTNYIIRDALVGVVMTPENAESLGRWLLEKVSVMKTKVPRQSFPENKEGQ